MTNLFHALPAPLVPMGAKQTMEPTPTNYDKQLVHLSRNRLACNLCGRGSGPDGHSKCRQAAEWRAQDHRTQEWVCAEADRLRREWARWEHEARLEKVAKDKAARLAHEQYQLADNEDESSLSSPSSSFSSTSSSSSFLLMSSTRKINDR